MVSALRLKWRFGVLSRAFVIWWLLCTQGNTHTYIHASKHTCVLSPQADCCFRSSLALIIRVCFDFVSACCDQLSDFAYFHRFAPFHMSLPFGARHHLWKFALIHSSVCQPQLCRYSTVSLAFYFGFIAVYPCGCLVSAFVFALLRLLAALAACTLHRLDCCETVIFSTSCPCTTHTPTLTWPPFILLLCPRSAFNCYRLVSKSINWLSDCGQTEHKYLVT